MRTKNITIVGVGGLLAIALAAWRAFDSGSAQVSKPAPHAADAQGPASSDRSLALQDQLNALQMRVLGLQQQIADGLPSASAPVLPPRSAHETTNPEEEQKRMQAHMDGISADFDAEPRNPGWARERTTEVQTSIDKGELLKKAFQNLECRASMCRLELLDDRSQKFFAQLNDMAISNVGQFPTIEGQHVTRADGTQVTVYYFLKEGT